MTDRYAERRDALFQTLDSTVGPVVLPAGRPQRYFTGIPMTVLEDHHGSERSFLVVLSQNSDPAVVAVGIEAGRVNGSGIPGADIYTFDPDEADSPAAAARAAFGAVCDDRGFTGKVAVPFESTRLLDYEALLSRYEWTDVVNLMPTYNLIRETKDDSEAAALRRAGAITDECLEAAFDALAPGVTERDVLQAYQRAAVESDADGWGVTLVASGDRTAEVFASTSDREIQKGDPVLIDTGIVYDGYYTDVTRTVVFGEPSEAYREMYTVVREANRAMRESATAGTRIGDLDQAGWEVITENGFGGPREGSFGHGIGVDPHEPPFIAPDNDDPLEVGHAITVEPGIYRETLGGVRIEDDILVGEDGPEVISSFPRELLVY